MRRPAMRLISADFPTLGLPTIAIKPAMRLTCRRWRGAEREKLGSDESEVCYVRPGRRSMKEEEQVTVTEIEVRVVGAHTHSFELKSVSLEQTEKQLQRQPTAKV